MKSFTIALNSGSFIASAISASISSVVLFCLNICLMAYDVHLIIFKPFAREVLH